MPNINTTIVTGSPSQLTQVVNDSVVLAINQTSSSVSDSDIATDIITNNREINTVVQVLDGSLLS